MAITVLPPLGTAIPDGHHAISVQLPTWRDMCGLGLGDSRVMEALQNGYPRSFVHRDIQKLARRCQEQLRTADSLLLFPEANHATACRDYLLTGNSSCELITVAGFGFTRGSNGPFVALWATVFPAKLAMAAALFWRLTGTGISSRLAERCLGLDLGRNVLHLAKPETSVAASFSASASALPGLPSTDPSPYQTISTRIASLLHSNSSNVQVDPSDVFLYPSGMSAIYHLHQLLLQRRGLGSAIVGFPYELTIKMLQTYGPALHFYSLGTDAEIDRFEADLASGRAVLQAVWCECPSNPLLWTVDLDRIRRLADRYDFLVIVDDTIGSFANVDVLPIADVVVTSLSKSFNGFADLLAGSIALNPAARHHAALKDALNDSYVNNFFIGDAIQLEQNSRDFLQRQSRLNANAECLADYLAPFAMDPSSAVKAVYYPKLSPSAPRYRARMRQPSNDFTPGYGCLLTIEFDTVPAAMAFFDNLDFLKGPSLGLHHTLAQPYVQMVLQNEKQWAASHGLMETIVRISAGLEDKELLLSCLKRALVMARRAINGNACISYLPLESVKAP